MKLITMKPITNGSRHKIKLEKSSLVKNPRIFKNLIKKNIKSNGRSTLTGHITAWHRGGGHKTQYRKLHLNTTYQDVVVIGINYDPNRSAFIATVFDIIKKKFYNILAPNKIHPGSLLKTNIELFNLKLGFRTQLKSLPIGTIIHNISNNQETTSKYVKAAGASAQLIQVGETTAQVKLPSNTLIKLPVNSFASLGVVSNPKHNLLCLGKAGTNRHLNRRPITRGIAMNPVDHPHGGRTNGGRPSVTPWGLPTKSKFYLKRRSKNKKIKIKK